MRLAPRVARHSSDRMIAAVTDLRGFARESALVPALMAGAAVLLVWAGAEYVIRRLLTRGQVPRLRMLVVFALITIGRLCLVLWSANFLTAGMVRRAEAYGPIGVVFATFTGMLVYWMVLLGTTLLAAVLTDPDVGRGPESARVDLDAAQGDF